MKIFLLLGVLTATAQADPGLMEVPGLHARNPLTWKCPSNENDTLSVPMWDRSDVLERGLRRFAERFGNIVTGNCIHVNPHADAHELALIRWE
jgi:hypothetical protein